MMNFFTLVGRLNSFTQKGIKLDVSRPFKNSDGEYEIDVIPITLLGVVKDNTMDYCKVGDVIGIKGRIAKSSHKSIELVAEKVSFISTRRSEEDV